MKGDMANIYRGYVAIDDVKLLISQCTSIQLCDFENEDICNYDHDVTADFRWERSRGQSGSLGTGPSVDHTYQSEQGHYMRLDDSPPQEPGFSLLIFMLLK
jgi:hypothetical protein